MAFATVTTPGGGLIALCPLPRVFELDELKWWRAKAVLTLAEQRELEFFQSADLGERIMALGMAWRHLPVPDMGVPDRAFEARWTTVGPETRAILRGGGRVAIHCHAGLGRTGMVAARLLIEMGATPDAAIAAVRAGRPGAIETAEQEAYVRSCTERK